MIQGGQLALDLGHRPALGAEDFLVAPSNENAVALIDRWPRWDGAVVAIYGPAGCGKTHLAHVWQQASGARLCAASDLGGGLAENLGSGACIALEDAEHKLDEEALLHLYNAVREGDGHMLLTGRTPPARWDVGLPDLASRLRAVASSVEILPPDDALLAAVLVKMFDERQLRVGEEVVLYLLPRMVRSFAGARSCVEALDRRALSSVRAITVPFVRDALQAQLSFSHAKG